MESLAAQLQTLQGQLSCALVIALLWCSIIEGIHATLKRWVRSASWWPRAQPNQVNLMANFGYPRESCTEETAIWGFVWVVTMCGAHVVNASLMFPVILCGWEGAGPLGRLCFQVGVLAEVGFEIYDWSKNFLLAFLHGFCPWLGPRVPKALFFLLCVCHHTTVLCMVIPMNLKYVSQAAYHWIAFSLLFSAGVCYGFGQYKFTLDGRTREGLAAIKRIVLMQFITNWLTRVVIWFPASVSLLRFFYAAGDTAYFCGGCGGIVGMTLYNVVVASDATTALVKWLPKTLEDKAHPAKADSNGVHSNGAHSNGAHSNGVHSNGVDTSADGLRQRAQAPEEK